MAKVDGFNVFFSHRGAWTADLLAPGKEKEVIPVTWTKDWNRQAGTLFVWLKRSSDVERYMSLTEGFPVAIGRYNEHGGASAEDIVGIFFVVPLDASTEPIGIACKVIRRVKPTDARPTAGF
jgi:hypothetical protein